MALKKTITKAEYDALPDVLKGEYIVKGDGYKLDVDGDEPGDDLRNKLNEFRDNNRNLMAERQRLEAELKKFDGVDPEAYRKHAAQLAALKEDEERKLLQEGKFDELITRRVAGVRDEFGRQISAKDQALAEATSKLNQTRQRLGEVVIDRELQLTVTKLGKVRPGAMQDIMLRGRATWSLDENGQPVARDSEGKPVYGAKGEKLTYEEWGQKLLVDAPYLFEATDGGGGSGGDKGNRPGNSKVIANDPTSIGRNLEDIASGKVLVEGAGD